MPISTLNFPKKNQKQLRLYYLLQIANFEYKRLMNQIVFTKMNSKRTSSNNILIIKKHTDLPNYIFMENRKGKFECPEIKCGLVYPSIIHVKMHYLEHLKTKPLRCLNYPKCDKYFSRKDNMMLHYRNICKVGRNKMCMNYD